MKKYVYSVLILSLFGAVICGILLIQYYFPESSIGFITCGTGIDNPYILVSHSEYSTILGLPIASYGLFSYLIFVFTVLIADYATGKYYGRAIAILFPVSLILLVMDFILIIILIILNEFSFLYLITYIIDLILLITIVLWYKEYIIIEKVRPASIYSSFFSSESENDKRAAFSSYIIVMFFLAFAVFSTTNIIKTKAGTPGVDNSKIKSFINQFKSSEEESIIFPESSLVLGNKDAKITIRVFADFLCSACYSFYKMEDYLLARFKNDLKIVYYNFPLDISCNTTIDDSIYENSCIAAESMVAAAKSGIFKDYHRSYFQNYKEYKSGFNQKNVMKNLDNLKIDKIKFQQIMKSKETTDIIKSHIKKAAEIKIDATPTLFIKNRRLVGSPPREFIEAIIKDLLGN